MEEKLQEVDERCKGRRGTEGLVVRDWLLGITLAGQGEKDPFESYVEAQFGGHWLKW